MAIRAIEHTHRREQGHGGLTFLTLIAVPAISIAALYTAVSNGNDASDAELAASVLTLKMAETQVDMDTNLRSLQQLGADVGQLQGDMAKVATSSEATVVEAELRSTLASIEASIARTQADVVVIKNGLDNVTTSASTSTRDIQVEQAKVAELKRSLASLQNALDSASTTNAEGVANNQASLLTLESVLDLTVAERTKKLAYATVGNVFIAWWNHGTEGKGTVAQGVDMAVAATDDAELVAAWESLRDAQTAFDEAPLPVTLLDLNSKSDAFLELLATKLVAVNAP